MRAQSSDDIHPHRHAPSLAEKVLPKDSDEKPPSNIPSHPRKRSWFSQQPKSSDKEDKNAQYDSSLVKALHATFWIQIWSAGILKLLAGILLQSIADIHFIVTEL